jgi:hypothetical protein
MWFPNWLQERMKAERMKGEVPALVAPVAAAARDEAGR